MTNRIWPVNAVAGSPQYAGRALRQTTVAPFVPMKDPARPLGAISGVRAGTPQTIAGATSASWWVYPHAGILDLQTAAEAGPYTYAIDTTVSGNMVPADATNPRTDLIYIALNDPAEAGTGSPSVSVNYIAGTPAASPAWPTLPVAALVLLQISVPKAGGGSPSGTWVAPQVGGGRPPIFPSKAFLDSTPAPIGTVADLASGDHYVYQGASSGWQIDRPFAEAAGFTDAFTGAVGQYGIANATVNFPTGRFTQPPIIDLTATSGRMNAVVLSVTATQLTIQIQNNSNGPGIPGRVYWTAKQMRSNAADG